MPRVKPLTAAQREDEQIRRVMKMAMSSAGKTQQDIGDMLGVSRATVYHYLKRPSMMTLSTVRVLRSFVRR